MGPVTPIPEEFSGHGIAVDLDPAPAFSITDWGFDTVAIAFRPDSDQVLSVIRSPIPGGARLSKKKRGRHPQNLFGDPDHVSVNASGNWSMQLGFAWVQGFPDTGIVRVEGRAAALLARSERALGLVKPQDLSKVVGAALTIGFTVLGWAFSVSLCEFRRWDLTVDLRTAGNPQVGRRTMEALASVRLPYWGRAGVHHDRSRLNFVTGATWPATGRRQFRVYDKGVELKHPRHREKDRKGKRRENSRAEPAGTWLRLERQSRPTNREHFMKREELEAADLRSMFLGRWASLLDDPSITVCSPQAARERLARLFEDGEIGVQTARRLIGQTAAATELLDPRLFDSHQALASQLASLGIVLAGDLPPSHSVELKPLLTEAAAPWPAGEA